MINYRTKRELDNCYVCLYDSRNAEQPCTVEPILQFISSCRWQLVNGKKPRRIPFFISNIPSECSRASADLIRDIQASRKKATAKHDDDIADDEPLSTLTIL